MADMTHVEHLKTVFGVIAMCGLFLSGFLAGLFVAEATFLKRH